MRAPDAPIVRSALPCLAVLSVVGKIVRLGKLPVNVQGSAYYNVVRPDNAAEWQLRLQI